MKADTGEGTGGRDEIQGNSANIASESGERERERERDTQLETGELINRQADK